MTQETNDVVGLIERLRREGSSSLVYGEQIIRARELANEAADALQSQSARIAELREERDKWKERAFNLECEFGDLKGVYVTRSSLTKDSTSGSPKGLEHE